MRPYPKIETLFNRGKDFTVDVESFRRPEFAIVSPWLFTEKIDGTNIRIDFRAGLGGGLEMLVGGRTDRAQLPPELDKTLASRRSDYLGVAEEVMSEFGLSSLTLFAEGYGPKIQKGGGNYRANQDVILFDVLINDKTWLDEDGITSTATRFGMERVPAFTVGTVEDAISLVRRTDDGYMISVQGAVHGSSVPFEAEGIVARPLYPLFDNRGNRVMWKLKGSDFRAGKR